MADEVKKIITIEDKASQNVKNIKNNVEDLTKSIDTLGREAPHDLKEINKNIKDVNNSTKDIKTSVKGAAGTFIEGFDKMTDAVDKVIPGTRGVVDGIRKVIGALKALKAASLSNPWTAILAVAATAVTAIVANWEKISKWIGISTDKSKEFEEEQKKIKEELEKNLDIISKYNIELNVAQGKGAIGALTTEYERQRNRIAELTAETASYREQLDGLVKKKKELEELRMGWMRDAKRVAEINVQLTRVDIEINKINNAIKETNDEIEISQKILEETGEEIENKTREVRIVAEEEAKRLSSGVQGEIDKVATEYDEKINSLYHPQGDSELDIRRQIKLARIELERLEHWNEFYNKFGLTENVVDTSPISQKIQSLEQEYQQISEKAATLEEEKNRKIAEIRENAFNKSQVTENERRQTLYNAWAKAHANEVAAGQAAVDAYEKKLAEEARLASKNADEIVEEEEIKEEGIRESLERQLDDRERFLTEQNALENQLIQYRTSNEFESRRIALDGERAYLEELKKIYEEKRNLYLTDSEEYKASSEAITQIDNKLTLNSKAQGKLQIDIKKAVAEKWMEAGQAMMDSLSAVGNAWSSVIEAEKRKAEEDGELSEEEAQRYNEQKETLKKFQIATTIIGAAAASFNIWRGYAIERIANAETAAASGPAAAATLAALNAASLATAIANQVTTAATAAATIAAISSESLATATTSTTSSSSATPTNTVTEYTPQYTQSITGRSENEYLANALSENIQDIKVYVVESDITNAQKKKKVKVSESSF